MSDNGEEERKEDANRAAGGGAAGNPSDSAIICSLGCYLKIFDFSYVGWE